MQKLLKKQLNLVTYFFFLCIPLLIFFHLRGFVAHDEGWILNPATRLLHGEAVYRDFHFIYTPGTLFFTTGLYALFGESVIIARLAAVAIAFLTLLIVYSLVKRATGRATAGIRAASLSLAWGPMHINFLWPVMFAVPACTAACLLILKAGQGRKSKYFLFTGMAVSLAFLSKQNFGAAMILSLSLYFLLYPPIRKIQYVAACISGFLLALFPVLLYFLFTGTLRDFAADMYYFMIEKTIFMRLQDTPFFYPAPLLKMLIKNLLYLTPFIISGFSFYIAYKYTKKLLILPLFSGFFYLFGIRPTTDYIHLLPLLAVTGIPLSLLVTQKKLPLLKAISIIFALFLLVSGLYDALLRNYYRWDTPILNHTVQVENPKLGILMTQNAATTLSLLTTVVNKYSDKDDFVFFYAYTPLYYMLLERRNPTRFDFFPPLNEKDQREIVIDLQNKAVQLIVTEHPLKNDDSTIAAFIKKHYSLIHTSRIFVWKKNHSPLKT